MSWQPAWPLLAHPPTGFDQGIVARGEQLARISNCVGCHTAPGGRPFAGGRPLETPFGTVFATNITPDPETGIGLWSRKAFARALREGVARSGDLLYPAFPYDHFTHAGDADIDALYAFLMTRPAVQARVPANRLKVPFGFRPLIAGWNLLFLHKGSRSPTIRASRPSGIAATHWPRDWRIAAAVTRRATNWAPREATTPTTAPG